MTVHTTLNGDVEIAYDTFGPPGGTPLLLLMGAGAQIVAWPRGFIDALVERGCHVVTVETRDSGQSAHLHQFDGVRRPYSLRDMTDDVIAVFDALGWSTGHVLGASQGGIIAQATAVAHPDRVSGLISMSSTPGTSLLLNRPRIGTMVGMVRIMSRKAADRDEEGRRWVDLFRLVGSPGYPLDEDHWFTAGQLMFDHGRNAQGELRQFAAVRAAGDRRAALAGVRVPTLVLHGEDDPMVSVRAGRATAAAVPGARFLSYPGMGHDLPTELFDVITDEITRLCRSTCAR